MMACQEQYGQYGATWYLRNFEGLVENHINNFVYFTWHCQKFLKQKCFVIKKDASYCYEYNLSKKYAQLGPRSVVKYAIHLLNLTFWFDIVAD